MTGSKLLIGSVLLFVVALIMGSVYYTDTTVMSMADTSMAFTSLRVAVAGLLAVLLVTRPPRSYGIRVIMGTLAAALGALSVGLLFSYEMRLLDALVFLEVAIIFAVEALEVRTIRVKDRNQPPKRIAVRSA